jgi:hypothetical protein
LGDPDLLEKDKQYGLVKYFFASFKKPDGSLVRSITEYETPGDFRRLLRLNLDDIIWRQLQAEPPTGVADGKSSGAPAVRWSGSPYPGLRAFTEDQTAIFFGREREALALERRLREAEPRFVAVVGASGTGKSSLVRAGLMPRLAGQGQGQGWPFLIMTPAELGGDPLLLLASRLFEMIPLKGRPARVADLVRQLRDEPERIAGYARQALAGMPDWARLVLVIDQLEELFTPAAEEYRGTFTKLLARAAGEPRLRVLVTLREDFLSQCAAEPELAGLLQAGTFILGPPGPAALVHMIRKPAERAGLELEESLADQILKEGGSESGALPLVAFCLEELYRRNATGRHLTLDAYRALGGLQGAIRRRAAELLEELRQGEELGPVSA